MDFFINAFKTWLRSIQPIIFLKGHLKIILHIFSCLLLNVFLILNFYFCNVIIKRDILYYYSYIFVCFEISPFLIYMFVPCFNRVWLELCMELSTSPSPNSNIDQLHLIPEACFCYLKTNVILTYHSNKFIV